MYTNSSRVIRVQKDLPVPNLTGQNCTVSFYVWINNVSDGALSASFRSGKSATGQKVWSLRKASDPTAVWFQRSVNVQVTAGDTFFTVRRNNHGSNFFCNFHI